MSQHRIMRDVIFPACSILLCCCMAATNRAADWPTYRYDTNRSAVTSEQLKLPLSLVWQRESSAELRRAWSEAEGRTVEGRDLYDRLRFDDAFQVAVAGQFVYFGSSVDHQLHCVHAGTGETKWSYFTGAPIRLAPTISEGRVYVGSDDGYAYCLDANRGELIWKYRPGPNEEWFLGRGEMISRWPVRTGILVDAGIAYFGAGIFPHENVYMCAVNAETGKVVWRNDSISHQQAGREDLSPQGYLLASDSHIHVPSGRTLPKSFERESGKLVDASVDRLGISTSTVAGTNAIMFEDRLHAYSPGSQIAGSRNTSYVTTGTHLARLDRNSYSDVKTAASALRNQLRDLYRKHVSGQLADEEYQEQTAELREKLQRLDQADVGWRVPCTANSAVIVAGNHVFVGGQDVVLVFDATNGKELFRAHVAGDARGLAAAAGKLFVSTSKGSIYAFGESGSGESHTAARSVRSTFDEDPSNDAYRTATEEILQQTQIGKGFCLIVDCE